MSTTRQSNRGLLEEGKGGVEARVTDGNAPPTNPSLGIIGKIYYDPGNNRVKYFSTRIHQAPASVEEEFDSCLEMMAREGATRVNMRALVEFPYQSPHTEAVIPLNNGRTGTSLVYLGAVSPDRRSPPSVLADEDGLVRRAIEGRHAKTHDCSSFEIERLASATLRGTDVSDMVELYHEAFTTYTTKLDHAAIRRMVANSIVYAARGIASGQIIATAVAEQDTVHTENGQFRICELSEMATRREYRGRGIISETTKRLVEEIRDSVDVIYAEARACHFPVNQAFANLGFAYGGRLNKQCVLSGIAEVAEGGPYENLNVWYLLPQKGGHNGCN